MATNDNNPEGSLHFLEFMVVNTALLMGSHLIATRILLQDAADFLFVRNCQAKVIVELRRSSSGLPVHAIGTGCAKLQLVRS